MIQDSTASGRWRLPLAAPLLMLSLAACAHDAGWRHAEAPLATTTAAPQATAADGNTAAELQALMAARALVEMRTTYNGPYGASLLFHADTLTYYAALFHDKQFWRVIRTDQFENAETLYSNFAAQTQQLAQVYLDTLRLDAGKRHTERLVAMNERRLRGLEAELAQQQQQAAAVSQTIAENRQQAINLSGDLRATNTQLEALQKQIRALQARQLDPALNLPAIDAGVPLTPPADASQP